MQTKLRDRIAPNDDEITRETYVNTLSDLWLAEIIAEERITPQTIDRYTASLRIVIRPAIGNLRLREATVGRLDKMFRTVAADRPSLAKNAKVATGQMFALAVRRGALGTNPVRETSRIHKPRHTVIALEPEQLEEVRAAIQNWQQPTPGKPGPRHNGDLADIVDLLFATGARIGEVLALRWEDIDLAAEHPTLTICGTIVYVKGTTRSSPRGAAPGRLRRTYAANGAKPAPIPVSNGSPRTPPARPSPASSTRKPTPRMSIP